MSVPSLRGMLSPDSCLQRDTRNSHGTSGNVFEDLLAPNEQQLVSELQDVLQIHIANLSLNTGRLAARTDELERKTQNFAILAPRFARKFSTLESSFSGRRSLSANLHD